MKSWISLGIFSIVIFTVFADIPECPPSQSIYPCFCERDHLIAAIDCTSFHDLNKLYPILKETEGKNFSFAFWKSRLGDIPSDLFKGQKTESLHFENCKIGSFGDKPFSGLEDTLKSLFIYGSVDKRIKDLETFPLGHLKKLEYLAFQANDIKRLGNEWFDGGPESLTQMTLEANDIEVIEDRAFASLVNLQQIWLGDNRFKVVKRSMFPRPANSLEILEISFNGIEVLPEDLFEDMPKLNRVVVSGNKLKTVPESTWGKIWDQLEEVYLERNSGFQCDDNLKWIYQRSKLPQILTGKCPYDNRFKGKELEKLTLKDFE